MQIEVLIVDVGKQVTVHHQHGVIIKVLHKLDAANSPKEFRFAHRLHLHLSTRHTEMLFYLLFQIVHRHGDMLHTIRNQTVYIMVNDALVTHLYQRLRSFQRQRTQTLSFAACHQHGIEGQTGLVLFKIDNVHYMISPIEYRHQFHLHLLLVADLFDILNVIRCHITEIAKHHCVNGITN